MSLDTASGNQVTQVNQEAQEKLFTKTLHYSGPEGLAACECKVNVNNELRSGILITFAPSRSSDDARPAVAKFPQTLIIQMAQFPLEMQGIPWGIIAKFAHELQSNKGKSVLEELRHQELSQ